VYFQMYSPSNTRYLPNANATSCRSGHCGDSYPDHPWHMVINAGFCRRKVFSSKLWSPPIGIIFSMFPRVF
jgi:hypothetical protein